MKLKLFSKEDALKCIAQIGKNGQPFEISLGEDICFGHDKWVNVGTITLQPGGQYLENETRYDEYCAAKFGGFEWQILSLEKLNDNITEALENSDSKDRVKNSKDRVQKAFREGLQDVLRRTLLLLPIFDVETIGKIPLQKPITIVTDTFVKSNFSSTERGRFELPEVLASSDFKSDAIDHSATSPVNLSNLC